MVLHDVAITQDQQRMLCVATLTASPDGLKPSMSREEKQIIGKSVLPTALKIAANPKLSVQSREEGDRKVRFLYSGFKLELTFDT